MFFEESPKEGIVRVETRLPVHRGLLWRLGVGRQLLRRVSVAGGVVRPKKVWGDAHTPKKAVTGLIAVLIELASLPAVARSSKEP